MGVCGAAVVVAAAAMGCTFGAFASGAPAASASSASASASAAAGAHAFGEGGEGFSVAIEFGVILQVVFVVVPTLPAAECAQVDVCAVRPIIQLCGQIVPARRRRRR